jgi:formamidopyrimidine-DNA glycosylase
MPELPEVETVVRGLRERYAGARIDRVVAFRPDLRFPLPADLGQRLGRSTITGISRRAKYGLVATDRGDTMLFHLGMTGSFRPGRPEKPHDHLLFETDRGPLCYHDPRRFGFIALMQTDAMASSRFLAALGPEPFAIDTARLVQVFAGRKTSVKALLLDQRVLAGLGNIYASEALFRAGIAPAVAGGTVAAGRLALLADAVEQVLTEAIASGGSTLRDYRGLSGDRGWFQHRFRVYGRNGAPCPQCGAPIERMVQNGRSTFWCRQCQH